jgi:hypothetical protein
MPAQWRSRYRSKPLHRHASAIGRRVCLRQRALRVTVLPNRNGGLLAQCFPVSPHHPEDAVTAVVIPFAATVPFGP